MQFQKVLRPRSPAAIIRREASCLACLNAVLATGRNLSLMANRAMIDMEHHRIVRSVTDRSGRRGFLKASFGTLRSGREVRTSPRIGSEIRYFGILRNFRSIIERLKATPYLIVFLRYPPKPDIQTTINNPIN